MTLKKIHRLLNGELKPYVNVSHIARRSGTTKQALRYWLDKEDAKIKKSPMRGMLELQNLCQKIVSTKSITEKLYKKWKKFLNMKNLCNDFLNTTSSSVSVMVGRKDPDYYKQEFKDIARFILEHLKNGDVKNGKTVDIKIKLP